MQRKAEFLTVEEISNLQQTKLQQTLAYVNLFSPYYKSLFLKHKINPETIGIQNLNSIPFTTKDDLARQNNDFLCVSKNKVADYVTTSGTLSDPVTFYLTANDLERLAYNEALSLACTGAGEGDVFQLTTTMDKLFMAGIAYFLGIQKLGAGIIRIGPGTPHAQWDYMLKFSPTVLIAIPSFIPKLLEYAVEHGVDYKKTTIKKIICLGEPIRHHDFSLNELGKRILEQWDVQLYSTYASTEMGSAFTECSYGCGGHAHPELLVLEVVDEKGLAVNDGELGEVVVTTLGVEGMPLLRYKTGDLCHVYYGKCNCGRNTPRLGPVMGRKQQMIKYKGTTLYPQAIFNVLNMLPVINIFQVQVSKDGLGNDEVTVLLADRIHSAKFESELQSLFKSKLRVTPKLKFIGVNHLNELIYKADKRKPEKIVYL